MRALVTGGAGFVGRHLCMALLDRGWDVVCVDPVVQRTGGLSPANWPLYDPRDYASSTYVDQDCRDYFRLNKAFEYAFHLAAMVGGRLMIECDPLAVTEDLAIDADFFRYALRIKPRKSVFFCSSAAYPISLQRRESTDKDRKRLCHEKPGGIRPKVVLGFNGTEAYLHFVDLASLMRRRFGIVGPAGEISERPEFLGKKFILENVRDHKFALRIGDNYLSADNDGFVRNDRGCCLDWEHYRLIRAETLPK